MHPEVSVVWSRCVCVFPPEQELAAHVAFPLQQRGGSLKEAVAPLPSTLPFLLVSSIPPS